MFRCIGAGKLECKSDPVFCLIVVFFVVGVFLFFSFSVLSSLLPSTLMGDACTIVPVFVCRESTKYKSRVYWCHIFLFRCHRAGYVCGHPDWTGPAKLLRTETEETLLPTWVSVLSLNTFICLITLWVFCPLHLSPLSLLFTYHSHSLIICKDTSRRAY